MAKYRIKKHVSYDKEIADVALKSKSSKITGTTVFYTIEEQVLPFLWMTLKAPYGVKFSAFETADEAKTALNRHLKIEKELKSNNTVVEKIKV